MKTVLLLLSLFLYDWLLLFIIYLLNGFDLLEIPFQIFFSTKLSALLGFVTTVFLIVLSAFFINKKYKLASNKLFGFLQLVFLFSLSVFYYLALGAISAGIMGA